MRRVFSYTSFNARHRPIHPAGANFFLRRLLAGAALQVLQTRLAHLRLLALRLADDESAAADVLGLIKLLF